MIVLAVGPQWGSALKSISVYRPGVLLCLRVPHLQGVTLDFSHNFVHTIGNAEITHIFHPWAAFQKRNRIFFFDTMLHWLQMVAIACRTLEKL